jgi:hypothetical protein
MRKPQSLVDIQVHTVHLNHPYLQLQLTKQHHCTYAIKEILINMKNHQSQVLYLRLQAV